MICRTCYVKIIKTNVEHNDYVAWGGVKCPFVSVIAGYMPAVNKTKFLGIIIEEHLNWAMHINHLCNIIARNVGILQKLRYFIPAYVLKILYHSLILSHLQYCTLLWANSYYSHLHKLRLLQKKAIRILSNTDYQTLFIVIEHCT